MISILLAGIKFIPTAINIGKGIYNFVKGKKGGNMRIEEALQFQINDLRNQIFNIEDINRRNEETIRILLELLDNNNLEEREKKEYENKIKLLEKEKEEKELQILQLEKEKESIEKSRKFLSNEFTESIFEIVNNFSEVEEKWIDFLQGPEIDYTISQLKEQLGNLFDKLYENEKVFKKINNQFINNIKTSFIQKELRKMNFIIIGNSGVGKSTLINEIFGEQLAREGNGKRTTLESKKYESKLVPFLSFKKHVFMKNANFLNPQKK